MRRRFRFHHPVPPLTLGVIVSIVLVGATAILRLGMLRTTVVPIGLGVPVIVIAYFRSRPLLWGSVIAFSAIIAIKYFDDRVLVQVDAPLTRLTAALMVEFDLLIVATMGHIWIKLQDSADVRNRELEEASIRKTRFLAAVSHDVRTPANAISLLADLIRRTAANPALGGEIPELAQELHSSAQFLVNLLTDVLDIARFDSGKTELSFSDFSLNVMLEEERVRLARLARQKSLACQWIAPPEPIWLRADRIKLSRVLGNLVGNAIKFTDKGEIRVEAARTSDGGIHIRVQDTGIGIVPDHQRDIFDEFVQLRNPERDRNKGTGLGLSICKRLVEAMNATLEVQSNPGQGSTFIVTLPADNVIAVPATLPDSGT